MKSTNVKDTLLAAVVCAALAACTQGTDTGDAMGEASPATQTEPASDTAMVNEAPTGAAPTTDPYATAPTQSVDPMTGQPMTTTADMGETTGDTLGDRCAGLTGQALSDCVEAENTRARTDDDPNIPDQ